MVTSPINSVSDYVQWVLQTPPSDSEAAFYRGHSDTTYTLLPSALRPPARPEAELQNYRDLMIANPRDFREDRSTFERLSRMQHYGLPTRLLDTSTNPLIALFFACYKEEKANIVGEVIRFTIPKDKVKYYDSDTVSCLANLALLDEKVRQGIDTSLSLKAFNESDEVLRLLHLIKEEKPYFRDIINPKDIDRVLCVRGRHSNDRVTAQSGTFLLFGDKATLPKTGGHELSIESVQIFGKKNIIKELDKLAINQGTAFRDISQYAAFIASRV